MHLPVPVSRVVDFQDADRFYSTRIMLGRSVDTTDYTALDGADRVVDENQEQGKTQGNQPDGSEKRRPPTAGRQVWAGDSVGVRSLRKRRPHPNEVRSPPLLVPGDQFTPILSAEDSILPAHPNERSKSSHYICVVLLFLFYKAP